MTVALNKVVIEFIAQLLHCAVQHGKMGVPVPDDECNAWREKCAMMLRTSLLQNHEGRALTLEPSLEQLGIHPNVRAHAAASIVKLHEAAMHAGADSTDFHYVFVTDPKASSLSDTDKWNRIAQ